MGHHPSLRRRDGQYSLDDDYYGPPPDDRYTGPPRRHQSERRRLRPGQDYGFEDAYGPRRGYPPREAEPRSMKRHPRPKSPPPEPRRELRHSRYDRDLPPRDAYERPRGYASDVEKPRRHREAAPPEYMPDRERPRRAVRDEVAPRRREYASPPQHRSQYATSPEPRRDRSFAARAYESEDDHRRGPRTRSHALARDSPPPPPTARGRDRDASHSSKASSSSRRKSAPAQSAKAKKAAWWQNPLVQAGARTALSAGAQAAMHNRHSEGEWMGSKGAKVATAALGAALMDGFGGAGKKK